MVESPDRTIALDTVVQWIVAKRPAVDAVDTLKELLVGVARDDMFVPRSTLLTADRAVELLGEYLDDANLARGAVGAMMAEGEAAAMPSYTVPGYDVIGVELAELVDSVVKLRNPARRRIAKLWFLTLQDIVALLPHHAFAPKVTHVYADVTARAIIQSTSNELSDRHLRAGVAVALLPYLLSDS